MSARATPGPQAAGILPLIYCWNRRQGPHQGAIRAKHEQSDPNQGFLAGIGTHTSGALFSIGPVWVYLGISDGRKAVQSLDRSVGA